MWVMFVCVVLKLLGPNDLYTPVLGALVGWCGLPARHKLTYCIHGTPRRPGCPGRLHKHKRKGGVGGKHAFVAVLFRGVGTYMY